MSAEVIVSVSALVVAAVALFIAFFQILLQCFVSSGREKCQPGCIGKWSKRASGWWEFFNFHLRVTYPVVDLDVNTVLPYRTSVMDFAPPDLCDTLSTLDCLEELDNYDEVLTTTKKVNILKTMLYTMYQRYSLITDVSK